MEDPFSYHAMRKARAMKKARAMPTLSYREIAETLIYICPFCETKQVEFWSHMCERCGKQACKNCLGDSERWQCQRCCYKYSTILFSDSL